MVKSNLSLPPSERKSAEILNGQVVDIADYPYQVAILNTKMNKIICGGVIVKPRVVLTAAHCTETRTQGPRKNIAVLVGANYLFDNEGHVHKIEKIVKHPDFSYFTLQSDMSVLLLKDPIKISEKARPIEISTEEPSGGVEASVSGWGRTETGLQSTHLRAVKVEIEDHHKCQSYFPGIFHPVINKNMVCLKPHHKSTYYGDSGGPLTVDGKLVGLVSFGRPVKPNKKTTVFTRVGGFMDFLDEAIPEEYQDY
ncbi:hypothetical protein ABEB36_008900 [Hypothenemus hampei]|uniref:Peptidase S1 domain-containing protein n=1 Tax=Hypothenemus hampei TaxID=57062 RepID=A0ABD1ENG4_HYPHA